MNTVLLRPPAIRLGDILDVLRAPRRSRLLRAYEAGRRQGRREAADELLNPGFWIDMGIRDLERHANRGCG